MDERLSIINDFNKKMRYKFFLLTVFFCVLSSAQIKNTKKTKPKFETKTTKVSNQFPFEIGDIVRAENTFCWKKEYKVLWQNVIKEGAKVVQVEASVENIKGTKMQIKILKRWSYYKEYFDCGNSSTDEPNDEVKYNGISLQTDELYWVDPNKATFFKQN